MNSFKKLAACMLFSLCILTYSCKDDDDDPQGCNYLTETQDELDALNAASAAYGSDPTPAKCQSFVTAYQNYLNELEDNIECATLSGQQAEVQSAIDQAQAALDAVQC